MFWKDPTDIINTVTTTFHLKDKAIAHNKTIHQYFDQGVTRMINNLLENVEEKVIEIIYEI